MAQLSYNYTTPKGVAGGLYDISPYSVDSRQNGEESANALKFGMGAVQGATPGVDIKRPASSDTEDKFEGLVLTSFVSEMDMLGEIKLYPSQTVGVLRYGKAWARIASDLTTSYGEPLYLIKSGADAGLFTNSESGNLAVNGRFIGTADSSDIAPVELYNSPAIGSVVKSVTGGTGIAVNNADPQNPVVSAT
ncbi:MAG: hypothetical protein LBD85_00075 [Oscillospiraceae bacterium]|jgi:hypothetical protein|nr:hypothetical protein [Oscillospiraceae bacterium]